MFYKVEASSKIHEILKKKFLLKITEISIFFCFSNKIFKKCTVFDIHDSIDNEIIIIFCQKFSIFHGFLKMLLPNKLEGLGEIDFFFLISRFFLAKAF